MILYDVIFFYNLEIQTYKYSSVYDTAINYFVYRTGYYKLFRIQNYCTNTLHCYILWLQGVPFRNHIAGGYTNKHLVTWLLKTQQ